MHSNNLAQQQRHGAAMGASIGTIDSQPKRETETDAAMSGLIHQIGDLRVSLSELHGRLGPVSRPLPPSTAEDGKKISRAYNSPLASTISDCAEQIVEIHAQVNSMLSALEV